MLGTAMCELARWPAFSPVWPAVASLIWLGPARFSTKAGRTGQDRPLGLDQFVFDHPLAKAHAAGPRRDSARQGRPPSGDIR